VLEFLFIDGRQDGEANHAKNGEMKSEHSRLREMEPEAIH
jgi:hypothetical protein